ncbi:unnamed protein product, partial [Eretmochelys imbricata]
MEEESVYEDMATKGLSEDSDVEKQTINPESRKDGDIVTVKASESFTSSRGPDTVPDSATARDNDNDSESDEGMIETSSEDKERRPLRRITVICTCCSCMKQDLKKKTVKS